MKKSGLQTDSRKGAGLTYWGKDGGVDSVLRSCTDMKPEVTEHKSKTSASTRIGFLVAHQDKRKMPSKFGFPVYCTLTGNEETLF